MIHDFEPIERSTGLARDALDAMRAQAISPSPLNYTVWYAHCSGNYPELSKALAAKLESGQAFSHETNQELFDRFFGIALEADVIRETGDQLHGTLEQVLGLVADAGRETGSYGETLVGVQDRLADRSESINARRLVQIILAETQKMVEKSRVLEVGLKESAKEIEDLRDHMEQLRKEAMTDALTGVANRKCFDVRLAEAIDEAAAGDAAFCLLMCDIDFFKTFNDRHGHKVGDEVLKVVGRHLREGIKGRDTAARYGGEEFALILPRTGIEGAMSLAESLREGLAGKELKNRKTGESFGRVTLSIGAAAHRAGESGESLLQRADEALYRAKSKGRNRVECEVSAEPALSAAG